MPKVETFKRNQWYTVIEDYTIPCEPRWRMKSCCYVLKVGDKLRFRGPNLGMAEFLIEDEKEGSRRRRLVILEPKVAFRVVGKIEDKKESE